MVTRKRTLFFAAASVLVGACTGSSLVMQTPPPPSGFPNSTHTPPVPSIPVPATFSGDLPKPLSAMTGTELSDFLSTLPRGDGMVAERRCNRWNPGCLFGGGKVKVGIQAAADARWLNDTNASTNGTVAALVENKGKYATLRYHLEPSSAAEKHFYAFIVFPKSAAGGPTYRLEDVVTRGTVITHDSVQTGEFVLCNHATWWDKSVAAFQTCTGLMSRGVAGSSGIVTMGFELVPLPKLFLANLSAVLAYGADDTPGWISCAAGCCTMGSALTD